MKLLRCSPSCSQFEPVVTASMPSRRTRSEAHFARYSREYAPAGLLHMAASHGSHVRSSHAGGMVNSVCSAVSSRRSPSRTSTRKVAVVASGSGMASVSVASPAGSVAWPARAISRPCASRRLASSSTSAGAGSTGVSVTCASTGSPSR